MFSNLKAEMARKRLSIKAMSDLTGINYESLKNKMSGNTEFKRSEMCVIKNKIFQDKTLDYLFQAEIADNEKEVV